MIWIGTSGWIYPDWVGRFYPPKLPVRDHLSYYAQHFPTVEVNRSFYRLPTRDQFCRWAEQTVCYPGFRFAVKASRYITHMKKLQDAEDSIARLITSGSPSTVRTLDPGRPRGVVASGAGASQQ